MGIHEINQLSDLSLALNFKDLSGKIISVDDVTVDIKLYTSGTKNIQILIFNVQEFTTMFFLKKSQPTHKLSYIFQKELRQLKRVI